MRGHGFLTAESVTHRIGRKPILEDVSAGVGPGEVLVLLGCNGAGKSTLLRCLSGDLEPADGQVTLDGRPLRTFRKLDLARRRAVLPQASALAFPFSVLEVVEQGRAPFAGRVPTATNTRAITRALELVDLTAFGERDYTSLSGGERQRVHLARALAQAFGEQGRPEGQLLLLDEPTSALDLRQQWEVISIARSFADSGGSVVIVLHDLNLCAAVADQVLLLNRGSVHAGGPASRVLEPETLGAAYGIEVTAESSGDFRWFRPGARHAPLKIRPLS